MNENPNPTLVELAHAKCSALILLLNGEGAGVTSEDIPKIMDALPKIQDQKRAQLCAKARARLEEGDQKVTELLNETILQIRDILLLSAIDAERIEAAEQDACDAEIDAQIAALQAKKQACRSKPN